jgi:hypothetical protein
MVALHSDTSTFSRILLAVSKTESPDAKFDWNRLAINSTVTINNQSCWADYPGFEVDEEAVYITNNMFTYSSSRARLGVRLWIVDKGLASGFYSGGSASALGPYDPYQQNGLFTTSMPAQVHGPGGAGPIVGTFLVSLVRNSNTSISEIQIITILNPLTNATFRFTKIALGIVSDLAFPPDAPQPGTDTLIDTGDGRVYDAVWRSNKLWVVSSISSPKSTSKADQATAHWVRIDTTAGNLQLDSQGDLDGETFSSQTFTYYPAVAVNKRGDVAFGYSASSSTLYAGAYGSLLLGQIEIPFTVKTGQDYYIRAGIDPRNRWGDYSGISVDPIDDSFWIFNLFALNRSSQIDFFGNSGRWGTARARVFCNVTVCVIIYFLVCNTTTSITY